MEAYPQELTCGARYAICATMDDVGGRLRELRLARGWSLKKLASKAGLSESFMSRVERNVSSLSIASLDSISNALGVQLTELLTTSVPPGEPEDPQECRVFRHDEQWMISIPNSSVTYRDLALQHRRWPFEILVNEFEEGYIHPVVAHDCEEFGYVLEGHVTLKTESQTHELSRGDCYFIQPNTKHTYHTGPNKKASVLMVSSKHFLVRV